MFAVVTKARLSRESWYNITPKPEREVNMDKILTIGDQEIRLRYGAKAIRSIEETAGKKIGEFGLKFINQKSGLAFGPKDKIPLDLLMGFLDIDFDFMLWIWSKGLDKPDEIDDLYDSYMNDGEPDDGIKLIDFKEACIEALNLGRGIDTKKLRAKNKEAAEKAEMEQLVKVQKAKLQAMEDRKKERKEKAQAAMTSENKSDSALEP